MYLNNKKIFLAGATGLAGTGILRYILDHNMSVKVRAAYCNNTKPLINNDAIEYVQGDLKSLVACRKVIKGCDCAIMAAAYTGGAGLVTSAAWKHIQENLLMNVQMLEAFQLEDVRRVIYIGSATLYQDFDGSIREGDLDLNKDPSSAYKGFGWVVRFIEKLCDVLHEQNGIEVIKVRAANIFGPYAKFDPLTSNFIPAIIRKAVGKMDPFEVWGSADVTRDVIYVDDFAKAIIMLADNGNIKHDTFNIGSETRTTVGDVVGWALKYADHRPSEIKYVQDKPTTMRFRALDCTKAKQMLSWQPRYAIEEGIRRTTEWWIENKDWWKK